MPAGGKRPNSGRRKGCKDRYQKDLDKIIKERGEMTPLDLFQAVQKDSSVPIETRLKAAAYAAPYVHKRKPQAMEITGRFEFLSPDERQLRRGLLVEEMRLRQAKQSAVPEANSN